MSWDELLAIRDEARQIADEDRRKPIVECPYDGTPLVRHLKRNILFCPNGDFQVSSGR